MPDQADVRRLALAMPEATETPHFERTSFRVRGKIFATMTEGGGAANLALPPELAASVLETDPAAVAPITSGAIMGWVRVDLDRIAPGLLASLVAAAWGRVAPKRLIQALAAA
jgi:hypothetical protein